MHESWTPDDMGRAFHTAARLRWRAYRVPAVIPLGVLFAETPEPQAEETEIPRLVQQAPAAPTAGQAVDAASGTPMAEAMSPPVLLNKRNNVSRI
jgi:hypothetical protein